MLLRWNPYQDEGDHRGLLVMMADAMIEYGFGGLYRQFEQHGASCLICRMAFDLKECTRDDLISIQENGKVLTCNGWPPVDAVQQQSDPLEHPQPARMPFLLISPLDLRFLPQARLEGADLTRPQQLSAWLFHKGRPLYAAWAKGRTYPVITISHLQAVRKRPFEVRPSKIPLEILYEDEDIVVVNKPKGMTVHPGNTITTDTLVNALLYHCQGKLYVSDEMLMPGVIHRLDCDTSGVLVFGKSERAYRDLERQTKQHSMIKIYHALAWGYFLEKESTVNLPIGRIKGHPFRRMIGGMNPKPSITHFRVMEQFGSCALIECRLETGRTHQIRVHMDAIGHPLVGDPFYGVRPRKRRCKWLKRGKIRKLYATPEHAPKGQYLHAASLSFRHPVSRQQMTLTAPLPAYFDETLQTLRSRQAFLLHMPGGRLWMQIAESACRLRAKVTAACRRRHINEQMAKREI